MKPGDGTFESSWRELRPGLERVLRARGAAPDVVDDVLQETSIRLLKVWGRVDHSRPLAPFARTIALNYLIDLHRVNSPVPVEEVPDGPSGYDLEEHALARGRLERAAHALDSLAEPDRKVLLAEVGVGERSNASATKMARLRARRRLTAAMDRVAAAFGTIQLSWRRVGMWFQEMAPARESLLPAMTAASIATVAVLGMAPSPVTGGRRSFEAQGPRSIQTVSRHRVDRRERNARVTERRAQNSRVRNAETATLAQKSAPEPQPSPTESTVVDAGNAKAGTREGRGYKGIEACTGQSTSAKEDDHSASVTADLGEGDDPGESCS